ncbi:hypothetical protein M153_334000616 [Pseudoloma neurophilia]|uniref:Uncharacterized protein n=1 Tax=Pseudoloma neurophilia TaxID=146866 RepID=A0A0R0LY23_9MICR|nr:hypothetical protein M153_334000616 [Pseudoloma neurophilia]
MTSQQSNIKDKDMEGRQQRTSRWNKEALITSVYVLQSLGQLLRSVWAWQLQQLIGTPFIISYFVCFKVN